MTSQHERMQINIGVHRNRLLRKDHEYYETTLGNTVVHV